jgi:hypothetical protein
MTNQSYAVFLSFNSEDRAAVEHLARYLADKAKLRPWFDHWELIPGEPWVRNLERGLAASLTCAVFVGKSGEGPWQKREVETALRQQVNNADFRVIPVLLPDAPKQPELPMFLSGNMWVDFRQKGLDDDDALWRLECGIRGVAPGRGRPTPSPNPSHQGRGNQIPPPLVGGVGGGGKIALNPFGRKGRITDPNDFFDRDDLFRQIVEEVNKGVNISLVGESTVGKSSVLSMVCARGTDRKTLEVFENLKGFQFVYFTLEWIENEDEFYDALCDELGIESCRGYKLTRALKGKRYILCLDEIEKMAWEGFTVKLRSQLRGLADGPDAPLKLVIASRSPLAHLFPDSQELDSPLAGICRQIDVKPFAPAVAREFLVHRLEGTGVAFTEAQIVGLISKTGGHPARLQDEAAQLFRELSTMEHG